MEGKMVDNLQYFVVIANPKEKENLHKLLFDNGAKLVNIIYGHSSVDKNYFFEAFGFEMDESKVILTCLATTEKVREIINILKDKFKFNSANTGIAFSIPLEELKV